MQIRKFSAAEIAAIAPKASTNPNKGIRKQQQQQALAVLSDALGSEKVGAARIDLDESDVRLNVQNRLKAVARKNNMIVRFKSIKGENKEKVFVVIVSVVEKQTDQPTVEKQEVSADQPAQPTKKVSKPRTKKG